MKLWGETLQSDRAVIDVLLADGGAVLQQDVAAETGYCYRTIREAVDRCSAVVKHTYGKLEIESKHQRKLLLQRMRTAEKSFMTAIENAAMTAAEVATGRERGRWSEVRRRHNITVDNDPSDCRKLLRAGILLWGFDQASEPNRQGGGRFSLRRCGYDHMGKIPSTTSRRSQRPRKNSIPGRIKCRVCRISLTVYAKSFQGLYVITHSRDDFVIHLCRL